MNKKVNECPSQHLRKQLKVNVVNCFNESTNSVKNNQSTRSNCNPAVQLRLKLEVIV